MPDPHDPLETLPLSPRDFLILLVLARGARHGYGIIKDAERHVGGDVPLDPANLYRALRRLDRDGLVAETDLDDESDGAPRRHYALTEHGRRVVTAEAERLARLTDRAREWRLIPEPGAGS